MTYLQRANGKDKAPFFYALNEDKKRHDMYFQTLCIGLTTGQEEIQLRFLSRGFFDPYLKITEKEFNDAKAVAQHKINAFGTEIIK